MVVRMGRGVLYHLHKARWWLSAGGVLRQLHEAGWRSSANGRCVHCQLHVRGVCVNYVSYFRKVGGCLSGVCNLLVIWGKLAIVCSGCVIWQVLPTRGWLSVGVCTLSVTLGRLADVHGVSVNSVSYFRKL